MTTRLEAEKAHQKARDAAHGNALAASEELSLKSPLPLSTYQLFASSALAGLVSAQVPSSPQSSGLPSSQLKVALDQLFERELVAWSTPKGWLHTREPRNPQTKRMLGGDLFMTQRALLDYGDDFYRIYSLANDFGHDDERKAILHAPQWRAELASQSAPIAPSVPKLNPPNRRRVR